MFLATDNDFYDMDINSCNIYLIFANFFLLYFYFITFTYFY